MNFTDEERAYLLNLMVAETAYLEESKHPESAKTLLMVDSIRDKLSRMSNSATEGANLSTT